MVFFRRYYLRYRIQHFERFFLREGVKEAARLKKNIQMGNGQVLKINEDRLERIFLPVDSNGRVDISPLLFLAAKKYPKEARRYVIYQRILKRISK